MDGRPQRPEAGANLVFLQKPDEERVPSKRPMDSQRSLASSETGSSGTMDQPNAADEKRKRMAVSSPSEAGAAKRAKIASTDQDLVGVGTTKLSHHDISQHLPAEVWQRIFTSLPPHSLGELMSVNRLFHKYLDPTSPFQVSAPDSYLPCSLPKLSPNTIWRASRRCHWPNMPSPLSGRSELDMWRFACTRSCQFCGQVDETDYTGNPLPWSRGPGNDTVSLVFQFFVASCGQCLAENSVKEVELLLSASNPSFIAAGAPTVFLTADLNVVTRQMMRNTPMPTSVQLTKVFWPAQLESLRAELEDARRFGAGAVEEWVKGLESRGAEAIRDASRWDGWYLSGGVRQMRRRSSSTRMTSSSNSRHVQHAQSRQTREEMKELKCKRQAEIEARAAQLHPPILPGVLHKLQAFQVASEMNAPLDDNEWKVLKLLLLDQRDKAELGGRKAAPKKQATHKYPTRSKTAGIETAEPPVQGLVDPTIRAEVSKLADTIINGRWDEGRNIKKKNCAAFASQVLTCVRDQFYATSSKAKASPMRRLTLDDMRWIFTHKIAPLTDCHGIDIFSCSKCPTSKLYSFQGVMQHHCQTHSGKGGKMSVHWKSEWTAELPFKPAPVAEGQSLSHATVKQRASTLAKDLAPAWYALKSVENIPASVKVSAAIHFIAKRYQELYQEPAPWELLFTGKCYNIIAVQACLACKVCTQKPAIGKNRTFKLAGLAHHFHQTHEHVDWRTGMVWVPDLCLSQDVAIRKNKRAFELISDALPWLFEDKEAMCQGDPVLLRGRQTPLDANQEANDAVAGPAMHLYPAERSGETLRLLPAGAVYSTPGVAHRQLAYKADIASGPNSNETGLGDHEAPGKMAARHSAREVEDWGGATWEAAHVSLRSVNPRHAVPEPRSYVEAYYVHREHVPHTREPPVSYPYYPDMERQGQQTHAAVEVRHPSRQPCTTRYYDPSMSSTAAYHYAEPIPSYDRYNVVDLRNLPDHHYVERPVAYHRQRTTPMPTISTIPTTNYIDTALASRVYSAYPSRH
ncbi:hypothetical protein CCMA1212_002273 [Trichoderma ghanense]|uniref:DUF7892 domain-containing protein n=1 Tax=Trichoderma ghanense TaxID=65468 RepID=A0ABY2HDJ9_9HYPO